MANQYVYGNCTEAGCRCVSFEEHESSRILCLCEHKKNFHIKYIVNGSSLIQIPTAATPVSSSSVAVLSDASGVPSSLLSSLSGASSTHSVDSTENGFFGSSFYTGEYASNPLDTFSSFLTPAPLGTNSVVSRGPVWLPPSPSALPGAESSSFRDTGSGSLLSSSRLTSPSALTQGVSAQPQTHIHQVSPTNASGGPSPSSSAVRLWQAEQQKQQQAHLSTSNSNIRTTSPSALGPAAVGGATPKQLQPAPSPIIQGLKPSGSSGGSSNHSVLGALGASSGSPQASPNAIDPATAICGTTALNLNIVGPNALDPIECKLACDLISLRSNTCVLEMNDIGTRLFAFLKQLEMRNKLFRLDFDLKAFFASCPHARDCVLRFGGMNVLIARCQKSFKRVVNKKLVLLKSSGQAFLPKIVTAGPCPYQPGLAASLSPTSLADAGDGATEGTSGNVVASGVADGTNESVAGTVIGAGASKPGSSSVSNASVEAIAVLCEEDKRYYRAAIQLISFIQHKCISFFDGQPVMNLVNDTKAFYDTYPFAQQTMKAMGGLTAFCAMFPSVFWLFQDYVNNMLFVRLLQKSIKIAPPPTAGSVGSTASGSSSGPSSGSHGSHSSAPSIGGSPNIVGGTGSSSAGSNSSPGGLTSTLSSGSSGSSPLLRNVSTGAYVTAPVFSPSGPLSTGVVPGGIAATYGAFKQEPYVLHTTGHAGSFEDGYGAVYSLPNPARGDSVAKPRYLNSTLSPEEINAELLAVVPILEKFILANTPDSRNPHLRMDKGMGDFYTTYPRCKEVIKKAGGAAALCTRFPSKFGWGEDRVGVKLLRLLGGAADPSLALGAHPYPSPHGIREFQPSLVRSSESIADSGLNNNPWEQQIDKILMDETGLADGKLVDILVGNRLIGKHSQLLPMGESHSEGAFVSHIAADPETGDLEDWEQLASYSAYVLQADGEEAADGYRTYSSGLDHPLCLNSAKLGGSVVDLASMGALAHSQESLPTLGSKPNTIDYLQTNYDEHSDVIGNTSNIWPIGGESRLTPVLVRSTDIESTD